MSLQIVVEDRSQRALALNQGLAESGGIGKGREAQDIKVCQKRAVLVIRGIQVHNFALGHIGIIPGGIILGGIIRRLVRRARYISIYRHIQRMQRIVQVEPDANIERNVLQG